MVCPDFYVKFDILLTISEEKQIFLKTGKPEALAGICKKVKKITSGT
jgi:hypothetical protein